MIDLDCNETGVVMNEMQQRTPEWYAARCGKITASRFKDVLAKLKNGQPAQARQDYLMDVVAERLTGTCVSGYTTSAMQWGIDQEPFARMEFERRNGVFVDEVGFVQVFGPHAGASADGVFTLPQGLACIEIKCPSTKVHLRTMLDGMPPEHMAQCQGVMAALNAKVCAFISFDPRLPEKHQLYSQVIDRDEAFIETLRTEVAAFDEEVTLMINKLEQK